MIAGPNGAGKTTFAGEFLQSEAACPEFVNAGLIAAGLSPFQSEKVAFTAGRVMLERMGSILLIGLRSCWKLAYRVTKQELVKQVVESSVLRVGLTS